MNKITTTQKISEAISNNLLQIIKAEIYYKTSGKTETMDADRFQENLDFLCESGCFADAIGWHFERDYKSNGYIAECGRMNPDTEIIVTIYFNVGDGVNGEDIERTLLFVEEE